MNSRNKATFSPKAKANEIEISGLMVDENGKSGKEKGKGKIADPSPIPGSTTTSAQASSFEPMAGPSGINYGASTSGLLPSSFEDEEEGKRPRKKMCSQLIDYGDYEFDDEEDDDEVDEDDYGYFYGYDEYADPNNNDDMSTHVDANEFGPTMFPPPLLHHSYTRMAPPPRPDNKIGEISQTDWNEAGPSGIKMNSGQQKTKHHVVFDEVPSYSDMSDDPPSQISQVSAIPSDSDISSSCSHHSLVDRYTHMNISGCEDQTDEECAFDESDDPLEDVN